MAMAGILHTFTIPRASCILTASFSPIGTYPISVRTRSIKLPDVNGLKLKIHSNSQSSIRTRRTVGRATGSIVCESPQETTAAVIVPAISDGDWESVVLGSDTAVLVEFWAPWCGPCRIIHPVIDELAKQYKGKLKCLKVNTDESPSIATRYGIRSIPTVILFKNGEKKDAIIGAVPKSTLTNSIEKLL
ncbi:thioredoxin M-type, chloroplastic-like [Impatiens glandulifera]|uniref:thioredoxin M-type, chloroplastic-like n=1 Tax=Impatiens glandulifera TaxID=253017 RepID=UPI001FB10BA7|nr:thioredoxin M-type, chloroplastic-like [Impatiens glandulifera]